MNFNPLSAVYGAVVGARNAFYDRRWLRSRSLEGTVISVGNLSTGGSGKTPFVILLGELLKGRGSASTCFRAATGAQLAECCWWIPAGCHEISAMSRC